MSFQQYLKEGKDDTYKTIVDFFSENPSPKDPEIHELANTIGIDEHEFESYIYDILGSFLGAGRSKGFSGEYDAKELAMGIKIEMEHTTSKIIAERIAKDHLAEIPDYYTRLIDMEKDVEEDK